MKIKHSETKVFTSQKVSISRNAQGDARSPSYQFFPSNFCKRRSNPQIFLTFSFDPFDTLVYQISRSCLVPIPNYWTCIKSSSQKIGVSGQILIKSRLRLVSFSQRSSYQTLVTWPHLQYNLSHMMKLFWWRHGQRLWRHNPYFKIPLF